jgi:hypothetical protein
LNHEGHEGHEVLSFPSKVVLVIPAEAQRRAGSQCLGWITGFPAFAGTTIEVGKQALRAMAKARSAINLLRVLRALRGSSFSLPHFVGGTAPCAR